MCIKRQAQDVIDVTIKRLTFPLVNDGFVRTGLNYAILATCQSKDKSPLDYLNFKVKIQKDKRIETKDYVLTYNSGLLKIEKKK